MIWFNIQLKRSSCKKIKLSVEDETHDNIYDEVDEDGLHDIDKMSLDGDNVR